MGVLCVHVVWYTCGAVIRLKLTLCTASLSSLSSLNDASAVARASALNLLACSLSTAYELGEGWPAKEILLI